MTVASLPSDIKSSAWGWNILLGGLGSCSSGDTGCLLGYQWRVFLLYPILACSYIPASHQPLWWFYFGQLYIGDTPTDHSWVFNAVEPWCKQAPRFKGIKRGTRILAILVGALLGTSWNPAACCPPRRFAFWLVAGGWLLRSENCEWHRQKIKDQRETFWYGMTLDTISMMSPLEIDATDLRAFSEKKHLPRRWRAAQQARK